MPPDPGPPGGAPPSPPSPDPPSPPRHERLVDHLSRDEKPELRQSLTGASSSVLLRLQLSMPLPLPARMYSLRGDVVTPEPAPAHSVVLLLLPPGSPLPFRSIQGLSP